jgi:hypothetical protein
VQKPRLRAILTAYGSSSQPLTASASIDSSRRMPRVERARSELQNGKQKIAWASTGSSGARLEARDVLACEPTLHALFDHAKVLFFFGADQ